MLDTVSKPTEVCPECGARYRAGRLACPECGSDATTGWQDETEISYQSVEIPEGWGPDPEPRRRGLRSVLYLVAAILALASMLAWSLLP